MCQLPSQLRVPLPFLFFPGFVPPAPYQLLQVQQLLFHPVSVALKHPAPFLLQLQSLLWLVAFLFCIGEESLLLAVLVELQETPPSLLASCLTVQEGVLHLMQTSLQKPLPY